MSVNISLFAGAGWQFFDDNGNPLSGGKIDTYLAGSTTPAVTYTNAAGSIQHTNPIILDSVGRVPSGEVWVPEGIAYKFVLKSSADVLIGTYDNLNPTYGAQDLANTSDPAKGDALVGFRQSNASGNLTGSVGRTVHQKFQEFVSVKDFGATGDGTTDDTLAIQAAVNAIPGSTVRFPYMPNGYVVNSTITIPANTSIDFEPGAFIKATAATALPILSCEGAGVSASLGGGLAASVPKGTQTITFNSVPTGLAANDVIILHNPANGSWNPARTYYKQGEFLVVQSVSGVTVTTTTQTIDGYAATCEVYKVSTTTCQMTNVKILGNRSLFINTPTILIRYGYGVTLKNIEIIDPPSDGVQVADSLNFVCEQIRIRKTVPDQIGPPLIQASGLVVWGQNGQVRDCMLMSYRRGLSITGGGYVITRFVTANNCFLGGIEQWQDLGHGGLEYCGIENSQISNGVLLSGQNNFVRNNTITSKTSQVLIQFGEMRSINHEISNNKIFIENTTVAIQCSVSAFGAMTSNMQEDGTLRILNNEFVDTNNAAKSFITIENQGSTTENSVEIVGNIYRGPSTANRMLFIRVDSGGTRFANVVLENNQLFGAGLGIVQNWDILTCRGNFAISNLATESFSFTKGISYGIVENNTLIAYNATSSLSGESGTNLGYASFRNNLMRGGALTAPGSVMAFSFANEIDSSNNKIGSMSDPNITQPMVISSGGAALNVTIDGDVYYGGPPAIGTNALNPSNFQFRQKVNLTTPATAFTLWTLPTNTIFMPTMAQGRADTDVTATNGNYYSIGVNSNDRRIDYGVSESAAGSSKYAKNVMLRFMSTPATASQAVVGGETLALLSVDSNADNAGIGSNMGGANQSITVQIAGNLIGSLETLP